VCSVVIALSEIARFADVDGVCGVVGTAIVGKPLFKFELWASGRLDVMLLRLKSEDCRQLQPHPGVRHKRRRKVNGNPLLS